jgi:hypothetical protein
VDLRIPLPDGGSGVEVGPREQGLEVADLGVATVPHGLARGGQDGLRECVVEVLRHTQNARGEHRQSGTVEAVVDHDPRHRAR